MFVTFLVQLAIALVLAVVAYVLMPKPKAPKMDAARDMEMPTAEAGRPVPVVFGEGTIKSPNCLGYWQAETRTETVTM